MRDDREESGVNLLPLILIGLLLFATMGQQKGCDLPFPVPTPSGATQFILLHEGTKDDQSFSRIVNVMQDSASEVNKKISAAGWKAQVLDDDDTTGSDQPNPLLVKLGVHGSITDSRRELLSVAPPDKLVAKEPIPADATPETVFSMMQAKGKR